MFSNNGNPQENSNKFFDSIFKKAQENFNDFFDSILKNEILVIKDVWHYSFVFLNSNTSNNPYYNLNYIYKELRDPNKFENSLTHFMFVIVDKLRPTYKLPHLPTRYEVPIEIMLRSAVYDWYESELTSLNHKIAFNPHTLPTVSTQEIPLFVESIVKAEILELQNNLYYEFITQNLKLSKHPFRHLDYTYNLVLNSQENILSSLSNIVLYNLWPKYQLSTLPQENKEQIKILLKNAIDNWYHNAFVSLNQSNLKLTPYGGPTVIPISSGNTVQANLQIENTQQGSLANRNSI